MGRDAEKKGLVGPCQRSGLAAGIKPQAEDGGNLRLIFFVAGTRPLPPAFLFVIHLIKFIQFIIINAHTV